MFINKGKYIMPNTIPATGEAMSETKKATDKEVACAMRSLETAVRELMHMAEIAADSFDTTFGPSSRMGSSGSNDVTYRITKHEDDQMSFLINDVAVRCSRLNKAFHAAWNGEESA